MNFGERWGEKVPTGGGSNRGCWAIPQGQVLGALYLEIPARSLVRKANAMLERTGGGFQSKRELGLCGG